MSRYRAIAIVIKDAVIFGALIFCVLHTLHLLRETEAHLYSTEVDLKIVKQDLIDRDRLINAYARKNNYWKGVVFEDFQLTEPIAFKERAGYLIINGGSGKREAKPPYLCPLVIANNDFTMKKTWWAVQMGIAPTPAEIRGNTIQHGR